MLFFTELARVILVACMKIKHKKTNKQKKQQSETEIWPTLSQNFKILLREKQTLIPPQVSYLTTLNNVYIRQNDNKETPNTESGFITSGTVSINGMSLRAERTEHTALTENTIVLVHRCNKGRQGRQQRGQTVPKLTHLDPDARQHLTAKITTVFFRICFHHTLLCC